MPKVNRIRQTKIAVISTFCRDVLKGFFMLKLILKYKEDGIMRGAIFDMDGLMFDTESVFVKAWDYVGDKLGIGPAGFMVIETLGMNLEVTKQKWRERFGGKCDEAEVERMTYEYIDDYYANNHVPVKKGLKTILDYLKGHRYRIAVASSSPENVVKAHLKDADIDKYFDVIMCGNMVAKSKPEPDIYIEAAGKLKLPTSECYAFEDSESGLKAALASGCRTIMVPDLWQPDDVMRQKVAAVCKDLDEAAVYIDSDK